MSSQTLDQILSEDRQTKQGIINVDEPIVKLVVVEWGQQWFACHGERIKGILAKQPVFFIPGAPPTIEGVINVRGDIESVLLPHTLLGLPATSSTADSLILIAQGDKVRSGIRVDRVIDVCDVLQSNILPPPSTVSLLLRPLILGVLQLHGRPVSLLDINRLLSDYANMGA
ncbi:MULTISPECIES: chemotaxis protein CheW [Giesbergeria]|uniref:Chemotaxis protein CheW n=1 Tax=Giesbergeria sinuosa TaxID=80883 RepID=A0ABV9QCZ1_9BURK